MHPAYYHCKDYDKLRKKLTFLNINHAVLVQGLVETSHLQRLTKLLVTVTNSYHRVNHDNNPDGIFLLSPTWWVECLQQYDFKVKHWALAKYGCPLPMSLFVMTVDTDWQEENVP